MLALTGSDAYKDCVITGFSRMILSCPSCNTRYNLEASALRGGLTVRCVKCGNSWHQDPPDDMPIVVDVEPEEAAGEPEEAHLAQTGAAQTGVRESASQRALMLIARNASAILL